MKKIVICGVTGNIGKQTIEVINNNLNKFKIVGISFHKNLILAKKIIKQFNIPFYFCSSDVKKGNVKSFLDLFNKSKPNLVLNALPGLAGLQATINAIKTKTDIALANKESLVCGGKFITKLARKNKVKIVPVDSEHSAIYSIINTLDKKTKIDDIIITASGGCLYNYNKKNAAKVTYNQALKNPNWHMGPKVSIDSATLLNKVFELIECYWLFNNKKALAIRDKRSIIHGCVLHNKTCYAFKSKPNMYLPIEIGLYNSSNNWKNIKTKYVIKTTFKNLFSKFGIHEIIAQEWSCYNLKNILIKDINGASPIIANAADEILIDLFKNKKIKIIDFYPIILSCIKKFKNIRVKTINDVYKLHNKVQNYLSKKVY